MSVTVTITHNRFPEIAARLPAKTSQVVRKAAFDIEARYKANVPVDTGALKNSIGTEISASGLSAEVAPGVEYAIYVEMGTRRMSARPALFPAAEAVAPAFRAAMEQMLRSL